MSKDACGRTAFCHFNARDSKFGTCTPFYSFDIGESVGINMTGYVYVPEGAERLCRSQRVDTLGYCSKGVSST